MDEIKSRPERPAKKQNEEDAISSNTEYSSTEVDNKSIDLREIADKLNGRRNGDRYLCCCPAHNDSRPSLAIKAGDNGKVLAKCYAGCEFKDIIRAIEDVIGGKVQVQPKVKDYNKNKEATDKAVWRRDKTWGESLLIRSGDPVHTYLTVTRKLPLQQMPADLRFHPSARYYSGKDQFTMHPAMIAAVRDVQGILLTLHLTFLTDDGKKLNKGQGAPAKKLLPRLPHSGGAIRLCDTVGDALVVAEGIESALAAGIISGSPTWAAINSDNLAKLQIPKNVQEVSICVDNDEAGIKASHALASRLLASGVRVFLAHASSFSNRRNADWADLMGGAA